MRQYRRLVAGPGADLQHLVALFELELLGHESHHIRLRDGLAAVDGERDVLISVVDEGRVDKQLARHKLDGAQYPRIADAAAPELHDQADLVRLTRHGERSLSKRYIRVSGDTVLLWQAKDLFAERRGERLKRALVGKIELQRRHRDAPRLHRPEIGASRLLGFAALDADPVIRLAARIEPVVDAQEIRRALALSGHRHTFDRARLAVRKIDVEHDAFGPSRLQQLAQQLAAVAHRRLPDWFAGLVVADGEAQRDRRHAEQGALDGAGNCPRIVDVVGEVLPTIDAGKDEVWRLVLEQEAHAHDDAVGRRPLHRVVLLAEVAHAQGLG